jgi:hypothetical protein
VVDTAMKRAMKGDFDLFGKAEALFSDLNSLSGEAEGAEDYFEEKKRYVGNFKKAILLCIHGASKQFGKGLISEQEVLNNIADMMMETYVAESLLLRVEKLGKMKDDISVYKDILDADIYETADIVRKSAKDAICSFADGETMPLLLDAAEKLTMVKSINIKESRRRIADKLIEDNCYKF